MPSKIQTPGGADWRMEEPLACLFECSRCGTTEVGPWADRFCEDCPGHPMMVYRRYATDEEIAEHQNG